MGPAPWPPVVEEVSVNTQAKSVVPLGVRESGDTDLESLIRGKDTWTVS